MHLTKSPPSFSISALETLLGCCLVYYRMSRLVTNDSNTTLNLFMDNKCSWNVQERNVARKAQQINFSIGRSTRKEIGKGVSLSYNGKNIGRLDWAGGGNGYEEVSGGISMAIREWMEGTSRVLLLPETQLLFTEVSFLLFFSWLNASLRSVSFS